MPVTVGSASTGSSGNSQVSSLTISVTVGAGPNRALVVGVQALPSPNPSVGHSRSITWNGQSLTRVGVQGSALNGPDGIVVELWYLLEASLSTTTANLVITANSVTNALHAGAQLWSDVDQLTPFGAFVGDSQQTNAPTLTAVSISGDVIVDMLGVYTDAANVLTATYTGLWKIDNAAFIVDSGQSYRAAGAPSTQIGWGLSSTPTAPPSTGEGWWYGAAALKAPPALMGQACL